jgi:hypothetical protein
VTITRHQVGPLFNCLEFLRQIFRFLYKASCQLLYRSFCQYFYHIQKGINVPTFYVRPSDNLFPSRRHIARYISNVLPFFLKSGTKSETGIIGFESISMHEETILDPSASALGPENVADPLYFRDYSELNLGTLKTQES